MNFKPTKIPGVVEVLLEPLQDERGFFARSWCRAEFERQGLTANLVQCSISFNEHRGTLRGLHYQDAPYPEAKLVRCTRGSIFDVAVDLRPQSPTFGQWTGVELSAGKHKMLFVAEGCAHGFITLEDKTEISYQMSEYYHPELSRGFRWNDPAFQIVWPTEVSVISARDRSYPDFEAMQCRC